MALTKQLSEQYHLSQLFISQSYSTCNTRSSLLPYIVFLNNKPACLTIPIPNTKPNHFITIKSTLDKYDFNALLLVLAWVNGSLILLGTFIGWILRDKLKKYIVNPIKLLAKDPTQFLSDIYTATEITDLHKKLILFIKELEKQRDIIQETHVKQSVIKMATQVAHDIRSPLTAISTAVFDIRTIPEIQRNIIKNAAKRINDIANNLLLQIKDNSHGLNNQEDILQPELIFSTIESILAEKRYEYSDKNIQLKLNIMESAYDCFSKINLTSFKRILSNLINNSIEAIQDTGLIEIFLENIHQNIKIIIEDDGCGIPSTILSKVTEEGFSYQKNAGTGVGLSYAKQKIEQSGGQFFIHSEVNVGTKITMLLPSTPSPIWFFDSIILNKNSVILVLDDDFSIHDIWRKKFHLQENIHLIHLQTETDLTLKLLEEIKPDFYFIDYELFNSKKNGIELIEHFGLIKDSALVTNAFECPILHNKCKSIGLKILPKPYVPYIPIKYIEKSTATIVFIDDNESLRMAWEFAAANIGENIETYSSPQNFIKNINHYHKSTVIYIDSELGENMKGEVYAKDIYAMGFKEIHLVTGHLPEQFGNMPWIKSILGKNPPFLNT